MQNNFMPLISIVIPTYCRSKKLTEAIESVVKQDYSPIQIIVSDDNTSLDEIKKVKMICTKYDNIKYIKNRRTKGGCGARNSGVDISDGKYIAFLDDDDLWYKNKLTEQIRYMEKKDISVSFSDALIQSDLYGNHTTKVLKDYYEHDDILSGLCPLSTSLLIVEKKIFVDVGMFDETLSSFQDFDLYVRISKVEKIWHCPKELVIFIEHIEDRTSINLERRFKGLNQILQKWGKEIETRVGVNNFKNMYVSYAYIGNAKAVACSDYILSIKYAFNACKFGKCGFYEIKWLIIFLLGKEIGISFLKYINNFRFMSK